VLSFLDPNAVVLLEVLVGRSFLDVPLEILQVVPDTNLLEYEQISQSFKHVPYYYK